MEGARSVGALMASHEGMMTLRLAEAKVAMGL